MLYKYREFINESRQDIDSICQKYNIINYTVNEDDPARLKILIRSMNRRMISICLKFIEIYKAYDQDMIQTDKKVIETLSFFEKLNQKQDRWHRFWREFWANPFKGKQR